MNTRLKKLRSTLRLQQGEFARQLEVLQQQLSKYERGENKPSADFFTKLVEKFKVNTNWLLTGEGEMFTNSQQKKCNSGAVEIIYFENPELLGSIKNPKISSVWLDKELVHDVWNRDEKNLRVMQMPGDVMFGGDTPIKNQDILIVDTSITDIMLSGVYAFTTRNDNFIFINCIKQKIDGQVLFYYWNKNYDDVIYTHSDLERIGFKVIGRVIKNLSIN